MLEAGTVTADQIQQAFGAIGYKPNLKYKQEKGDPTVTENVTSLSAMIGQKELSLGTYKTTTTSTPFVSIPYIEGEDEGGGGGSSGGAFTKITNSTMRAGNLSSNILNGGKIGDKTGGKDYNPEKDRYHEINEQIKDQEQLLNRLSKAKDKAFGANRLKIMDDEIAAQEEMLKKQEALLAEQEAYLASDRQKVIDTFGSKANFDKKGNLTNYNDLLMSTTNEEQAKILQQYEDTNNAIQEQREKLQDLKDTIQDLYFDKLNYKLELKLDLDESELKRLDYYLNKYSDDFSRMADSLELMIKKLNSIQ